MLACVFGAGGGIGAALVEALAARPDVSRVIAASRSPDEADGKVVPVSCDVTDEAAVARVAALLADAPPDLVIVATGALHFADGAGPEKSIRALDANRMQQLFALNTIAPAIVAKHVLPLLPRDRRSVFALLSARVGSISDNRLGGWHSYRASKAALNMLVRNFAIELARSKPQAIVTALHPGTVDTRLSRPFQSGLRDGQVHGPSEAAGHLLAVIDRLTPADSGGFFAWDGAEIPY